MKQKFPRIQYLPLTRPRACRHHLNQLNEKGIHVILDLEDSAQDPFDLEKTKTLKEEARNGLLNISESFDQTFKSKIYIRINTLNSDFFNDDINCIIQSIKRGMPIFGLFVPKTQDYEEIETIHAILNKEKVYLDTVPMIETSQGYMNLASILSADINNNLITKIHYGHFDYCLDSNLWPFPEPYHHDYWKIIKPIMHLLAEHKKVYIHTPFPSLNDEQLFWSSLSHIRKLMPKLEFWACTLNLKISLSDSPTQVEDLNLHEITNNQDDLINEAELIINDYYQGRANKRSFGVSSKRYIPRHHVLSAEKYLSKVRR
jgi:citrate lyase beta subunit